MSNLSINPKFGNLTPADATKHIEELANSNETFLIKEANTWMDEASLRPVPRQLFGDFWFENEVCILFADTNIGKSILAVQIADSISKGRAISGFPMECEAQNVMYFDFELSDKQFQNRYSKDYKENYTFSEYFLRIELNPELDTPKEKTFEEHIRDEMEVAIVQHHAKVIIIDNLTFLNSDNEKGKNASGLMKELCAIKKKHNVSILVLAHTPKRDETKGITVNDLAGSKMLSNFSDSIFAIGRSNLDSRQRYVKQLKVRSVEKRYDSDNICVCEIKKPNNFLLFEFIDFDTEQNHLKVYSQKEKDERIEEAKAMKEQGISNVKIAEYFNVSEGTVRKWLKK